MRKLLAAALGLAALSSAQTFDVASIRASQFQSADGEGSRREAIETAPDGLTMRTVTLRACLSWAYSIEEYQIDGPAFLAADRYEIAARASGPVSVADLKRMLGALLADRFRLAFHRETKVLPALVLGVARGGPKLRESNDPGPGVMQPNRAAMSAQHTSMAEFARSLAGPLRTPVLDRTGLTGRYDFTVDLLPYFPDNPGAKGGQPDFADIAKSALRDQLGLTLDQRRESIEVLVVDHAEKLPTDN